MYVPKKNPRASEPKPMCSRVSYVGEKKKVNLPIIKNQVRESQFVDLRGFDGEES